MYTIHKHLCRCTIRPHQLTSNSHRKIIGNRRVASRRFSAPELRTEQKIQVKLVKKGIKKINHTAALRHGQNCISFSHNGPATSLQTESYNFRIFTWVVSSHMSHHNEYVYLTQRMRNVVRSTTTNDVVVPSTSARSSTTVDSDIVIGDEGIEVRHGEDGISAINLAAASQKIISDSDFVNSLDCLPLVDDGDLRSEDEN